MASVSENRTRMRWLNGYVVASSDGSTERRTVRTVRRPNHLADSSDLLIVLRRSQPEEVP